MSPHKAAHLIMTSTLSAVLSNQSLQFIFVGGKGGVGKTTSSCALSVQRALASKRAGVSGKTLLISTDPAHNLSDAFSMQFSGTPQRVTGCKALDDAGAVLECMEIDPEKVMEKEFGAVVEGLQDELVADFREWITSVPGIDEAMALAEVLALVDSGEYSTLIFDTAPTGHTLRLLQLPQVLKAGIEKLQSWQTRLGGVMGAIAGAFNKDSDAAAQANSLKRLREKLKHYHVQVERIAEIFRNVDKTTFVCVCIAEHLSVFETVRLVTELRKQGISQSHVLVNQLVPRAFASMAATDATGKSRLPLQSLAGALSQLGLEAGLVNAAKEACELMGARSKIQAYYLKQLAGSLTEATIVRLPLLAKDLRGANNIAEFSENMVTECGKLQDSAAPALTDTSSGSEEMLAKLNSLLAAAEKKGDSAGEQDDASAGAAKRVKTESGAVGAAAATTAKPAEPAAGGVPPMMLLMQLQGVLGQPGGLQKVLTHADVVAARKSTPVVESFCAAVEASGPMAALGFLGNPDAMAALQSILPGVLKDVTAAAAPPSGGGSGAMDDDIYD